VYFFLLTMSSSEEEAEFGSDDDKPLSSLRKTDSGGTMDSPSNRRKRKAVNYADGDDDDDDDEDDDVPLAALKKSSPSKSKPKAKSSSSKKKKAKEAPKSPSKPAPSSSKSSSTEYLSASAALYESECKKGQLIQKLLCRWWYAVTWPDPSTLPEKPPKHYDELNGFQGVYVCTSGDKVGHILDMRDKESCPSFSNYAKKSSRELKELLLKALEEQKRQLIEAEGSGTQTEKEINDEIRWVNKKIGKPDDADKEASKVLKAAKMKL
jgi:hypothetical protein